MPSATVPSATVPSATVPSATVPSATPAAAPSSPPAGENKTPPPPRETAGPGTSDSVDGGNLGALFDRLRDFAAKTNQPLAGSLEKARLIERTSNSIQIAPGSAFQAKRLEDRLPDLQKVADEFFSKALTVELAPFTSASDEALPTDSAPIRTERERKKIQNALNDPTLNEAIKVLGGEIVEIVALGKEQPR